jgi:hypothetical protein
MDQLIRLQTVVEYIGLWGPWKLVPSLRYETERIHTGSVPVHSDLLVDGIACVRWIKAVSHYFGHVGCAGFDTGRGIIFPPEVHALNTFLSDEV